MIGQDPVFGVSDFVAIFNQTINASYPDVKIIGEIANFKVSKSRWVYFDLKDDYASVRFFGTTDSLPGPLEDGMMAEVGGRPYLHPQFNFSVQFYEVMVVGEGSLARALRMLMKKLEAEGLFDVARKRQLPEVPSKVAIISSAQSAGYGDFMKIINKRWPFLECDLYDVLVQGANAPRQIISAINQVNQANYEALAIIRGGGSADDLMAFNDERLVRAVAASRIPTLVAIGHEQDVSLSEMVADQRASTPSNAAEILVPDVNEQKAQISLIKNQLAVLLNGFVSHIERDISGYKNDLSASLAQKIANAELWLSSSYNLLMASDPRLPLSKGYALVKSPKGEIVKTAKQAMVYDSLDLQFLDGKITMERNSGKEL